MNNVIIRIENIRLIDVVKFKDLDSGWHSVSYFKKYIPILKNYETYKKLIALKNRELAAEQAIELLKKLEKIVKELDEIEKIERTYYYISKC